MQPRRRVRQWHLQHLHASVLRASRHRLALQARHRVRQWHLQWLHAPARHPGLAPARRARAAASISAACATQPRTSAVEAIQKPGRPRPRQGRTSGGQVAPARDASRESGGAEAWTEPSGTGGRDGPDASPRMAQQCRFVKGGQPVRVTPTWRRVLILASAPTSRLPASSSRPWRYSPPCLPSTWPALADRGSGRACPSRPQTHPAGCSP